MFYNTDITAWKKKFVANLLKKLHQTTWNTFLFCVWTCKTRWRVDDTNYPKSLIMEHSRSWPSLNSYKSPAPGNLVPSLCPEQTLRSTLHSRNQHLEVEKRKWSPFYNSFWTALKLCCFSALSLHGTQCFFLQVEQAELCFCSRDSHGRVWQGSSHTVLPSTAPKALYPWNGSSLNKPAEEITELREQSS